MTCLKNINDMLERKKNKNDMLEECNRNRKREGMEERISMSNTRKNWYDLNM